MFFFLQPLKIARKYETKTFKTNWQLAYKSGISCIKSNSSRYSHLDLLFSCRYHRFYNIRRKNILTCIKICFSLRILQFNPVYWTCVKEIHAISVIQIRAWENLNSILMSSYHLEYEYDESVSWQLNKTLFEVGLLSYK